MARKVIVDCSKSGRPGMELADKMYAEAIAAARAGKMQIAANIQKQADQIRDQAMAGGAVTYVDLTSEELAQQTRDLQVAQQQRIQDDINRRNSLLAMSDWTQLLDSPLSVLKKKDWEKYRQALRDLTFPVTTWPTPPA